MQLRISWQRITQLKIKQQTTQLTITRQTQLRIKQLRITRQTQLRIKQLRTTQLTITQRIT